jgi:hypothetical protein
MHRFPQKFTPLDFPNYFKQIADLLGGTPKAYAKVVKLIEKDLLVIVKRLQIPHITDSAQGQAEADVFFEKLNAKLQAVLKLWQEKNPSSAKHALTVFIGNDIVRALLRAVYLELCLELEQYSKPKPGSKYPDAENQSLADFMQNELRKPEFHLRRLGMQRDSDKISGSLVLGLGNKFDIYFQIEPRNTELEQIIQSAAASFIDRIRNATVSLDFDDPIKLMVLPAAEVTEITEHKKELASYSGDSLELLALQLSFETNLAQLVQAEFLPEYNILEDFIKGIYRYLQKGSATKKKHVFESLRALLAIPFLNLEGQEFVEAELDALDLTKLDDKTKEQLKILIRNAIFNQAHNRVHRERGPLTKLAEHRLVPVFANRSPITQDRISIGEHNAIVESILIERDQFLEHKCAKVADEFILYHGTPSFEGGFYILRNGFMLGIQNKDYNQGTAPWYGVGVYTTPNISTAQTYCCLRRPFDKGIRHRGGVLIPLAIEDNLAIRIADTSKLTMEERILLATECERYGCIDLNDLLYLRYNIDAIPFGNTDEVVILNTNIFKQPRITDILEGITDRIIFNLSDIESADDKIILDKIEHAQSVFELYSLFVLENTAKYLEFKTMFIKAINKLIATKKLSIICHFKLLELPKIFSGHQQAVRFIEFTKQQPFFLDPLSFQEAYGIINDLVKSRNISSDLAKQCIDAIITAMKLYIVENQLDISNISGWLRSDVCKIVDTYSKFMQTKTQEEWQQSQSPSAAAIINALLEKLLQIDAKDCTGQDIVCRWLLSDEYELSIAIKYGLISKDLSKKVLSKIKSIAATYLQTLALSEFYKFLDAASPLLFPYSIETLNESRYKELIEIILHICANYPIKHKQSLYGNQYQVIQTITKITSILSKYQDLDQRAKNAILNLSILACANPDCAYPVIFKQCLDINFGLAIELFKNLFINKFYYVPPAPAPFRLFFAPPTQDVAMIVHFDDVNIQRLFESAIRCLITADITLEQVLQLHIFINQTDTFNIQSKQYALEYLQGLLEPSLRQQLDARKDSGFNP